MSGEQTQIQPRAEFRDRHIGPSREEQTEMLAFMGLSSLDELVEKAAPASILSHQPLQIGDGLSEENFLAHARNIAKQNQVFKNYIGLGYYDCHTPTVIQRNVLENPGWYTAYTPYQAEISQGRMEALLNFQTMIMDMTAMDLANASLLDEGTAAAEAMVMAKNVNRQNQSNRLLIDQDLFPQTKEILKTRSAPLGIEVVEMDLVNAEEITDGFAVMIQYPSATGGVHDWEALAKKAKSAQAMVLVAADLLSLCLLKPPGEWGADVVFGSSQRFGVPLGFGGPHAAYFATKEIYKRNIPGRIIGVSKDRLQGNALRLALQTREQHIRREKATSNICTSQVLLAVMASMYAVYHGPEGLKAIAARVHRRAHQLAESLKAAGFQLKHQSYFDTLAIELSANEVEKYINKAAGQLINLGRLDDTTLLISVDETTSEGDLDQLLSVFAAKKIAVSQEFDFEAKLKRLSTYLDYPVFHRYHSETEMLRYLHRLEQKDLTLNSAMIPLGSCTMKLNATAEMMPVTFPEFAKMHPFAPLTQLKGYLSLIDELNGWLKDITGFAGISLQPNAGSQGEYAGLLVIRKYHETRQQSQRNICLIPSSAHGTNPASAVMAGMEVVVVKCDEQGNIDIDDLKQKALTHKDTLAALMVTYPSTHGVFEENIKEICEIIHSNGGQVYMDGANLNALVGIARPGEFGPDVCHLNLHKTFCIPHGGGGPGVGPIGVAPHLKPFLPAHSLVPECGEEQSTTAVSSAPWGSASILPISWGYIAMMGSSGLKRATQVAILNANYIAKRLEPYFSILYRGKNDCVAHECIVDVRPLKVSAGITVDDIAKRLIDYGFHAPTMSWPVAGTLMIEPTESESKQEIDRFCDAMIAILEETKEIESGKMDANNNVLKMAPHSFVELMSDDWDHPYSREKAAFPLPWVREHKFWVPVSRVDNAYGDRNLICSCPSIEEYASES